MHVLSTMCMHHILESLISFDVVVVPGCIVTNVYPHRDEDIYQLTPRTVESQVK